jgi:tetratricopeptide (TPR) repeat protein
MGFRLRRSLKIAPGVRLNFSAKSVGISAGIKGARVSVNSSGRVTRTLSVPGTGISHVSTTSLAGGPPRQRAPRAGMTPAVPSSPTRPKPLAAKAPRWEKQLYAAVVNGDRSMSFSDMVKAEPSQAATISFFEVCSVAGVTEELRHRQRALLDWLVATQWDPAADDFVAAYCERIEVSVDVAAGIGGVMPATRDSLALWAAELHQHFGDVARAIEIVEAVEPTTVAAVSLAELYGIVARWDDIIELTDGVSNVDEPSTFLLIQRGVALRNLARHDAARAALTEALRFPSRPVVLRMMAYVERGQVSLMQGNKAQARADFERLLADNSAYPGLSELLGLTE